MKWTTTSIRPGYLGEHKNEKYLEWDREYGEDRWRLVWLKGFAVLGFTQVCALYEEAYFRYLKSNHDTLELLVHDACDVYDDSPTNVASGLDYSIQETDRTHIQDVAIRRSLFRLNRRFEGTELIRIRHDRGTHPLSMTLSPGTVTFHLPGSIKKPWLTGWWNSGSVECFYQSNRFLQVQK